MKNYKLWCWSMLFYPLISSAQVNIDWVADTSGLSIALDSADNVFTINYEYNPGGDIYLTKRDLNGTFLWEASYNNTDNTRHEVATWVAADRNGNAIVSGTIRSGYSNPVNAASMLMKFDPDGNLLWRVVYENSFDGSYTKKCLVDSSNNIYVLGMGTGSKGFTLKVKKFAPDGTAIWTFNDSLGIGAPINFKFTPDGNLVLIGRARIGSINGYAKIDTSGQQIWTYGGVSSLTVGDADGDDFGNTYLVHGEYVSNGGCQIKKIGPGGNLVWDKTYSLSAFRIEVGIDNQPVICGFPNPNVGGSSFLKADEDGDVVWFNEDADTPHNLLLHAQLLMDASDNIYLAAGTLFEMAVCKVNSDGSNAWTKLMPRSYANAFELGKEEDVYVTGGATVKLGQGTVLSSGMEISSDPMFIFPVPANDILFLDIPIAGQYNYKVIDLSGRTILTGNVFAGENKKTSINVPSLSSGNYILLISNSKNIFSGKIQLQH